MKLLSDKFLEKSGATFSLLLADDDLDDQELIIEIVEQIDRRWTVSRTFNGLQVLEYLERIPASRYPSLILLDYKMPRLNGEEVLERLAQDEKYDSIMKVVLTSSPGDLRKERCRAFGAAQCLVKPDKASEMKAVLVEILSSACGAPEG